MEAATIQPFLAGGTTGAVVIIVYFVWKVCKHAKLHSRCCGASFDFETEGFPESQAKGDEERGESTLCSPLVNTKSGSMRGGSEATHPSE